MMVGLDKIRQWLKEMKEEQIIKDGGVPAEEDLKVPESTARDYHATVLVSLEKKTLKPCIRRMGLEYLHGPQKCWTKSAPSILQTRKISKRSSSTW